MRSRPISLFIVSVLVATGSIAVLSRAVGGWAAPEVSAGGLRAHVEWLSDPAREGRRAGLQGAADSAQYISRQFDQLGFQTEMQEFSGGRRNVIARYGTEPRYVLIGAHYDGQGKGNPSASDNATGVAAMIEIARALKAENLPASIVAIAFDDEEQGLNGSRFYVDHPKFPLENAMAALIFDTFGRSFIDLKSWTLFVLGTESSPELAGIVEKRRKPDMLVAAADLIGPRSDFANFAVKKTPYLFFSHGTHKDYHGPGDTPDRIDYPRMVQDAGVIIEIARDIALMKSRPAYLDDPRYPPDEAASLLRIIRNVRAEQPNLPPAYKLMFDDIEPRIQPGASRETFQLAATAILAYATPRFSSFFLDFALGPYYEQMNKPEIAAAIAEESMKWESAGN